MKHPLTLLHGDRDALVEEAGKALYEFAVNGCEQSRQRVLAIDARLAQGASLRACDSEPDRDTQQG